MINVTRITCPHACAAATLATILDQEGHAAVWYQSETHPTVLTTAPLAAVTHATSMANSMVRE